MFDLRRQIARRPLRHRISAGFVAFTALLPLSEAAPSPVQIGTPAATAPRETTTVGPPAKNGHAHVPVALPRFALNAWLALVIDDTVPGRWTDLALDFMCGPSTRVLVDGKPLMVGNEVPTHPFKLHWYMDQCFLFGPTTQFSGHAELHVTPHKTRFTALVITDFEADSKLGRSRVRERFTAAPLLIKARANP